MPSNERQRAEIAIKVSNKWREETGVKTGYVMIFQGKFFEFSEELPEYPERKNCPSAVDVNNTVQVVIGSDRRWENIYVSKRGNNGANHDHIAIIAKQEMAFCFPTFAANIREWFDTCKTDLSSKKWKRFELITLRQAFDCMYSGISLDRVLNGAIAIKREC